jgi:undecaprenyl-diphosphatase
MAIPAVFVSGLYELYHSFSQPKGVYGYPETLVATIVAFGVGYAVIAFLMRYIQTRSFLPFVIYRVLLGTALIVLLAMGIIQPL